MRRSVSPFLRTFLLLLTVILAFPQSACAMTASQMNIYTQDNYTDASQWALAGYRRTLESAGCSLFSFAHAIQWLTQTRRGDELLTELIGVCNDPNGLQGHPECTHSDRKNYTGLAYQNYIRGRYGISNHSVKKTEAAFESFLTTGGAIVFRGPTPTGGHIALAVDFVRNSNGVGFIHVIDSHPESFHRSSSYTKYYDSSFNQLTSYPTDGADYWIRFKDIVNNSNYRVWIGLRMAPTSVVINASSDALLPENTLSLTASVQPATAYQAVVWRSSDPSIATISEEGCVTAVAPGTVTLTAASAVDETIYAEYQLQVRAVPPLSQFTATLPSGVQVIPSGAFANTAIQYFRCPEGLQCIESSAFANCHSLKAVYIPDSVTSIASDAFAGCSDLILWSTSDYVKSFAASMGCQLFDGPVQ